MDLQHEQQNHPIEGLMKTAMQSIKEMVDVNTVVGDAVETNDGSVIIPISQVACGFAAGGGEYEIEGRSQDNENQRGIQILTLDGGYILATKPEYAPIISRMIKPATRRFSPAALETLAIIAYRQPLTKAEIEQIRGVKSDRVLSTLIDKGIIKEVGKKAVPGKPSLYGTTHEFLKLFAISSLDELPEIEDKE